MIEIASEGELAAVAGALAGPMAPYTIAEKKLIAGAKPVDTTLVSSVRALIAAGDDPLGETFCRLRSAVERRATGTVYTPGVIVQSMLAWADKHGAPARIVDPGCGSGRFIMAAARRFPQAGLVGIDMEPIAILMLRANASVLGFRKRLTLRCLDYRRLVLPDIDGSTLFIGNPPYVRHHDIEQEWKSWFAGAAAAQGFKASALAGLHIHFFLKTKQVGKPGDYGAFITSAEWLDVNYGAVLRNMLADGLGGEALHVLTPECMPFANTITTGAITCFRIGRRMRTMVVRSVDSLEQLGSLEGGKTVPWSQLQKTPRWTSIIKPAAKAPPGYIELGEICRVHRGQVTGGNNVWIAGAYSGALPQAYLFPAITKARELLAAGNVLKSAVHLRRVIDLPVDLEALPPEDRRRVDQFLSWARTRGADESYTASARRPWWSVKLRAPAPILCTYMARRPPVFVYNLCGARHVNIAHGLYPRQSLRQAEIMALVAYLSSHVRIESGRTYAGGLTKFEPKELERILIPRLEKLHDITDQMDIKAAAGGRRSSESHLPA